MLNTLNANLYRFSKNQTRANTATNNTAENLAFRSNQDHRRIRPVPILLALGTALNVASCASQPNYTPSPRVQRQTTEQVQSPNIQTSLNNCAAKAAQQGISPNNLTAAMQTICPDSMQALSQTPREQAVQLANSAKASYNQTITNNTRQTPTMDFTELKNSLGQCTEKAVQQGSNADNLIATMNTICPDSLSVYLNYPKEQRDFLADVIRSNFEVSIAARNNSASIPTDNRPTSEIGVGDIPDEYLPNNSTQTTNVPNYNRVQQSAQEATSQARLSSAKAAYDQCLSTYANTPRTTQNFTSTPLTLNCPAVETAKRGMTNQERLQLMEYIQRIENARLRGEQQVRN